MKRVIIESPYGSSDLSIVKQNILYLKRCLLDSLRKDEAPFASHGFYTQILNDQIPKERSLGMKAGLTWQDKADLVAVYFDYGITKGMELGIKNALLAKVPVIYRHIGKNKGKVKPIFEEPTKLSSKETVVQLDQLKLHAGTYVLTIIEEQVSDIVWTLIKIS